MIRHVSETQLNEWADDSIESVQRDRVERHLAACAECRTSALALRTMLEEMAALSREIAPPSTLHAAIRTRIEMEAQETAAPVQPVTSVRWSDRSLRSLRVPLAAAALIVISLTIALTTMVNRGRQPIVASAPPVGDSSLVAMEARYAEATAELEALLREVRAALPPGTIALLDRDLAVLDAALRETRHALALDPGNPTLTSILLASYEKKLDLLRFAADAQSL